MLNLAIMVQFIGLCGIMLIINKLARARESFERKIMIIASMSAFVQNAAYLCEIIAPNAEAAIVAIKFEYMGAIWCCFCYMVFIYRLCGTNGNVYIRQIIYYSCLLLSLAVLFDELHGHHYTKVSYVTDGAFPHVVLEYGPLFYCHVAIVFVMALLSVKTIIQFYRNVKRTSKNNSKLSLLRIVLVCPVIPILSMLIFALKVAEVYDPTPILLLIVTMIIILIMLRRNLFDLVDDARISLVENMGDAFLILDEFYNIRSYNKAAVELFPEIATIGVGGKISLCRDIPVELFMERREKGETFKINDKHIQCRISIMYDDDDEIKGYAALFIDVTAMHNNMEEILEMKKAADAANQAKSDFLANMSHEIRTPMNAIIGMSELIIEESVGRKVYEFASDIKASSQSLLTIINDILDISKIESGKIVLSEVDYYVEPFLDEILSNVKLSASEKGLILKKHYDDNLPYKLHGDNIRIKQIILNILSNAVKYTHMGYIKLSAGYEFIDEKKIKLIIDVEDTGVGLKPTDIEKIFQNFTQVNTRKNREIQGTGLGLAIAQNLTNIMGGDISVESEYGKGSKFTISVIQEVVDFTTIFEKPIQDIEDEEDVICMFSAPEAKVLVVDDNIINLKVATGLLEKYKLQIDTAPDGFKALDKVANNEYDIVFMDHMMPEMDGVETTRKIRQMGNDVTIIALTANALKDVRDMFLENGFQDFVPKPINTEQLFEALDKWIPDDLKIYDETAPDQKRTNKSKAKYAGGEVSGLMMFAVENVDFMEGVSKSPTGVEGYIELLGLYYEDGKSKVSKLKKLIDERDFINYTIEVHGLKSASYSVAANELADFAKAHEDAGRDGENDFILENFGDLLVLYKKVLNDIKTILDMNGVGGEVENKPKRSITREEVVLMTKDILQSVENFRTSEAKDKLDSLLNFQVPEEYIESYQEVRTLLKTYEDEKAEEKLREIIELLGKG